MKTIAIEARRLDRLIENAYAGADERTVDGNTEVLLTKYCWLVTVSQHPQTGVTTAHVVHRRRPFDVRTYISR
jgi:hypothetical protein